MTTDTLGHSVRQLEDFRFLTGRGRYAADFTSPGEAYAHIVRSPHAHAAIQRIDTVAARAAPGVLGVFTEADLAADGIGTAPLRGPGRDDRPADRATAPCAGPRAGAPCRRSGRLCRGRERRSGARRGRARHRRLPTARRGGRCASGLASRRAGDLGRGAGQPLLPFPARRPERGRGSLCRRRPRNRDRAGQQPCRALGDRAARGDRQLGRRRRILRPVADRPGRPRHPAAARGSGLPPAARAAAGPGPGCRRRLRHEEFRLPGMGHGVVGGATARAPGQMGGRAQRGVPERDPGPRQSYDGATRARRGRPISRPRRVDGGQSRRLSVVERPRQLDQLAGDRDGRGLCDPRGLHGRARRLYQHGADRRLSRRRQAGGQLPDRAAY